MLAINGLCRDANTTWGRKRAEIQGHPGAYNLSWVEIGNEQYCELQHKCQLFLDFSIENENDGELPLKIMILLKNGHLFCNSRYMRGGYLAPFNYNAKLKPILLAMEARRRIVAPSLELNYVLGSSPDFTAHAATDPPGERGNYSDAMFKAIVATVEAVGERAYWDLHLGGRLVKGEVANYEAEMVAFGGAMTRLGSSMRVAVLEENCCGYDIGRALMHAHTSIGMRRQGDLVRVQTAANALEAWQGGDFGGACK